MSYYLSRTDGELVGLARRGDRTARGVLVDRTLLPASRVAMHLEPSADAAVAALVAAYGDTFRRLDELEDGGRFLPVLLDRLDHHAPFPLDPASHAPLDPVDRDRVRRAVLGRTRARRGVPLAAALLVAAVLALAVTATGTSPTGITVEYTPDPADVASTPGTPSAASTSSPSATPRDEATPDAGGSMHAGEATTGPAPDADDAPSRLPDTR